MNEKKFVCSAGFPLYNPALQVVSLNGVSENERLTPKLARRAARVAFGHSSGVTVWSTDDHGYRLYKNSHRRLVRE